MKVEIEMSIEGGPFKKVILDKELVMALDEYNQMCLTMAYLYERGIDFPKEELRKIKEDCYSIFRKYNCDKWDVRANYKFNESKLIENQL